MEPNHTASPTEALASTRDRDHHARLVHDAIASFQAGHDPDDAFRLLFDRYLPAVKRFFTRKGFSTTDSLDLAQETFMGIYRGLPTYRQEARFETWLFKIATTTYLKRLRTQHTLKRYGDEVAHDELPGEVSLEAPSRQLDHVMAVESRKQLSQAVAELPEQMRKCLTLRIHQDLKYREIADVMRISIDTVKVHLFQARKRLRERLTTQEVAP